MVVALVIGGVLLLGMVAVAGYAVRTLPAGSSVPLHAGAPEYSLWLAKRAGLAAWLGIGVAAFAIFAGLTVSGIADNWAASVRVVLLPSVMCVVLASEAAAIISARRRGAVSEPAPDELPADEPLPDQVPVDVLPVGGLPADEVSPDEWLSDEVPADEVPAGELPPEPAPPGTETAVAEN